MKIILIIFCIVLSSVIHAKSVAFGSYEIEIMKIHRADLFTAKVHIWPDVTKISYVQLKGASAPYVTSGNKSGQPISICEIEAGRKAHKFSVQFLNQQRIFLSDISIGANTDLILGRISVSRSRTAIFLGQALLRAGLAVPYQTRPDPWSCY